MLAACQKDKQQDSILVNSEVNNEKAKLTYDLYDIEASGELIAATISGPDTYFEYRGREFGEQYELAEDFARSIGVRLRMEVAHDTSELITRLQNHEVDLIAMPLSRTSGTLQTHSRWLVNVTSPQLREAVDEWYNPDLLIRHKEKANKVIMTRKRTYPAMLNASKGEISQYDALLQKYSSNIGWDWRLLAAQCYQESAFDSEAVSWMGAQGLMQIMPSTAEHLGISGNDVFDPEINISAATRYLKILNQSFSDIRPQSARIPYILAAYNGGANHVRDAMALTRKYGKNDKIWRDVEEFILKLSTPQYYNDPVVKSGYLRGTETHNYVRSIMDRWSQYCGKARSVSIGSSPAPSKHRTYQNKIVRPDSSYCY